MPKTRNQHNTIEKDLNKLLHMILTRMRNDDHNIDNDNRSLVQTIVNSQRLTRNDSIPHLIENALTKYGDKEAALLCIKHGQLEILKNLIRCGINIRDHIGEIYEACKKYNRIHILDYLELVYPIPVSKLSIH